MKATFKVKKEIVDGKMTTVTMPYYGMDHRSGEALFRVDTETLDVDCLVKGDLTDEGITNTKNTIKVLMEAHEEDRKAMPQACNTVEPVRGPWWDFMSFSFYQGLIFPFLCFGAVVAAVVVTSWLLRLIQNCF